MFRLPRYTDGDAIAIAGTSAWAVGWLHEAKGKYVVPFHAWRFWTKVCKGHLGGSLK